MLPYAAYLRVYEPLTAFTPQDRARWARYAGSRDRPRRAGALEVEHGEAVRRLLSVPPLPAPERESPNAYLRRVEETLYVCPWQSRLRSWLAFASFRGSTPVRLASRFVPQAIAEQTADDFDRFKRGEESLRTYIRTSTWHVPTAWFVPFDSAERWLVLGSEQPAEPVSQTTAAPPRNMLYVTSMAQARRRVARALVVIRRHVGQVAALTEVEDIGRWLEEFHPHSLVELDYGGLVHLMDDRTLQGDQSVAEVAAALAGLDTGQEELAFAMYQRVIVRWRSIRALESAN
ncbi:MULTISPECIES: hypothetical protein [Microbispora]|uniref:DUF8083 domain-containing protein n=3 Tax=Microbispora TaxID=2005 RepID=A0ABY3LVY8_9ACTN|nr:MULTISPECIES: hypothetical protein [Microbispora]RGA00516.1 hypothetical protein DI270_034390 [Microbispora triticiradicis]TLP57966.1 hypothetical protein FED44_20685 [Microbispora fusca]TYB56269.1 hypothetical protein FXF59_20635 [Microbispora tritici]GLW25419.1 hypothetical protein Mame01_54610 [Microbispora amethystogenes]